MFASIAEEDPRLHPDLKGDLEMVVGETKRCARIVQGLLEFSHETVLEKKTASVNQLIKHTLAMTAKHPSVENLDIMVEEDPMLPDFSFDTGQIEQVFINIILNAAQAMANGGVLLIKTRKIDNTAVVEFTDTGSGIPDDVMENIFDPFFTTKGRNKGTGLGLSISYGIVKSHGGTIEVESILGKGTTFAIRLPL